MFAAFDLYTKRSYEAQQVLFDEIAPKFTANGLILDELVLRNITFTDEYARTLEEKQIALENISTERNKLEQEKMRKEQKIVAAEGDARSIEIRQAALTKNPTIIQWEFVQKLAPNIQWGIMPNNMVPVINMKAWPARRNRSRSDCQTAVRYWQHLHLCDRWSFSGVLSRRSPGARTASHALPRSAESPASNVRSAGGPHAAPPLSQLVAIT